VSRPSLLANDDVARWLSEHERWRLEEGHLVTELKTKDYASGADIVMAQVALANRLEHHPMLTLGYRELRTEVWTHDQGGITSLDLEYANGFDQLLEGFGDVLS
jgi:4a-hydroxytetrahydrobiopterin dehydratase